MNANRLHATAMAMGATLALAAFAADTPPRVETPAAQSIQEGSGTVANGANALGAPAADAGGTTIGSGADTAGSPGIGVDAGTVSRPLAAQGRNGLAPKKDAPRRKQLYGINPKADDAAVTRGSTR
jgi:hypothetical protein